MSSNIKKILVVEDNYIQRSLLEKQLTQEGYKVLTAENGLHGLEVLKNFQADFILLDFKMPHMNGIQMANYLKKENNSAIIIFISSQADIKGTYLLDKPLVFNELKQLLNQFN